MSRFALLVATSNYEDQTLAALKAPEADVAALGRLLGDSRIGAFDDVKTLLNQSAAEVRRAVCRFFAGRDRDDLLSLYFSGHGILDRDGQLYLTTTDTQRDLLRATALPSSFVTDEMNGCRSARQLLILDCCHSGAFARGAKGAAVGVRERFKGNESARIVMTATDAVQFAWEGDQVIGTTESSLFTHFLIEGLESGAADEDGDGEITADELFHYASRKVRQNAAGQTPQMWSFAETARLVIATNGAPRPIPELISPFIRERAQSVYAEDRLTAVAALQEVLLRPHQGRALAARQLLSELLADDSRKVSDGAKAALDAKRAVSQVLPVRPNIADAGERPSALPRSRSLQRDQVGASQIEAPAGPRGFRRLLVWPVMGTFLAALGVFVFNRISGDTDSVKRISVSPNQSSDVQEKAGRGAKSPVGVLPAPAPSQEVVENAQVTATREDHEAPVEKSALKNMPGRSSPPTGLNRAIKATSNEAPTPPKADSWQDREAARGHFGKGKAFLNLGKYDNAVDEFELSYESYPDPALLLNLAQAYRLTGKAERAVFFYGKYLQHVPKSPYRADIEDKIASLNRNIQATSPLLQPTSPAP